MNMNIIQQLEAMLTRIQKEMISKRIKMGIKARKTIEKELQK